MKKLVVPQLSNEIGRVDDVVARHRIAQSIWIVVRPFVIIIPILGLVVAPTIVLLGLTYYGLELAGSQLWLSAIFVTTVILVNSAGLLGAIREIIDEWVRHEINLEHVAMAFGLTCSLFLIVLYCLGEV